PRAKPELQEPRERPGPRAK
ncbi:hypothetical protein PA598K_07086, partial [Paenibacillus sp. 598K]